MNRQKFEDWLVKEYANQAGARETEEYFPDHALKVISEIIWRKYGAGIVVQEIVMKQNEDFLWDKINEDNAKFLRKKWKTNE